MIPLVKQPIDHEYAHFYFATSQKTTAKTKNTRKIPHSQCHHQYHTSAAHLLIWCTYVPFSPHRYSMYISSTSSLLVSSTTENTTSFSDLQRRFDLNVANTLSVCSRCYRNVHQLHQFPPGPAYTRKTLQGFRVYKDCLI